MSGEPEEGRGTEVKTIADLTPDPRNARAHNPRNVAMIVDSLQQVGGARSIVIDERGVVLAGNATVEAAAEAGIERVKVVEADGAELVAVRRRGLTPEQKAKLALFDNRTSDLSDFDPLALVRMAEGQSDIKGLWTEDEWREVLAQAGDEALGQEAEPPEAFKEYDEGIETQYRCPKCGYEWSGKPK